MPLLRAKFGLIRHDAKAYYPTFFAATLSQQYSLLGYRSHVCLLIVDQALAATAKFPHIQTAPQHKHLLAMLPDQYAGLRIVRLLRVCHMSRSVRLLIQPDQLLRICCIE